MADWTALTAAELGADVIFTAPTAQALYDNPAAIAEGATGAPRVQTAAIDDLQVTEPKLADQAVTTAKIALQAVTAAQLEGGGVGQGMLKTSTGSGGGSGALPGGQYGFYPRTQISSSGVVALNSNFSGSLDSWIVFTGSGSWAQRYVTSSPPFDLGDGEVRGFLFIRLRGGNPVASWSAIVPPWAYNGPTEIRAEVATPDGRKWRRAPKSRRLVAAWRRGQMSLQDCRERCASPEYRGFDLVEITQAMKQRDMTLIPHPWPGHVEDGEVVVLLDPVDPFVALLLEAQDEGEEDVGRLLLEGRVRPDNEPLRRKGPPGVMQVRLRA